MPRPNPPRLSKDVDRHGNVRWYVRVPGKPKVRLTQEYGSDAFWSAYRDALAGKPTAESSAPGKVEKGSFRELCQKYYASSEFKLLDTSTRAWRTRALDLVCKTKGSLPVDRMETKHVRRLRDELEKAAANQRLKALKALFGWAVAAEEVAANPARDVKLVKYTTNGHHSWTVEEVLRFEKRWPLGTKPRLAMMLLYYSAGRREDAVRLGPSHIQNGRLRFQQAKNEHRSPVDIDIPADPRLLEAIEFTPHGEEVFLETQYGEPFTPNGFGNWFRERCKDAGVPGRAHGLRKAIAARLAESQATPHEVMSVTGHKTLEEVERYARAARKPRMADSAMMKLQAGSTNVPPGSEVGQEEEKSFIKQAHLAAMALPWGIEPQFSP
ncbi:MAG: integrase [Methylobacterium sp.]|nr:integrase [Methylobacterium sp.]